MDRENPTHIMFKRRKPRPDYNDGKPWVVLDHNCDRFTEDEYLSVIHNCIEAIVILKVTEAADANRS